MFSINNRREVQQGLYNLYTKAVGRLPPKVNALFIATVTGIFAVAAVSLYLYNRVTPLPPTKPTPPPTEPGPATLIEAQTVKKRQQTALRNASENIRDKEQKLLGLQQQFNQLDREISDWSATYAGEIDACHEGDPRHHLCVAILRALSPTISNKELRQVTGSSPSPSQSLARLIHNPFSKLARQSRRRMNIDVWWWNWKEKAEVIREISIEVLKFRNSHRTPKSSADEASVMEYVNEEFRPFIQSRFDEIVAANKENALVDLLMRKLDLNESDRLIIKESIEQFSRGPFDYPLLSAVRHNPFSRLRKHEELFIPYDARDRKALIKTTLEGLADLPEKTDKIMQSVDEEFRPCIASIFEECWASHLIKDLDLCDSDESRLARIAENPSATHLADLMGILDKAGFPDYSYDPAERCPLASYLPTAQAFHATTKSPLVKRVLDPHWVAFIKRSFQLAHRVMELQARLEQLSSECSDTDRDLQHKKGINTSPFIERLQKIAFEANRVQQMLNKGYSQLSSIIPER